MTRKGKWAVVFFGILVAVPALFAQSPAPRRHIRVLRRQPPQQTAVLPPQPSGPLPQVSLDQLPPAAPHVSYQNGSLSILAQNSTLGDILREVHRATGASIDVPANANERVAARLGPAPARDVLASLLNGSSFNYVMVGSVTDPDALASVMLTAKPGGGAGTATQTAEVYQPPPVRTGFVPQPIVAPVVENPDENAEDSEDADAENQDEEQPAGQPVQPVVQPEANNVPPQPDVTQPNAGPKSPQQIMEMLRQQMQQQNRQPEFPANPPEQ